MKRLLLAGGAIVAIDQATKKLFENKSILATKFFSIKYTQNTGAAFGILEGGNNWLLLVNIAVLIFVTYYYYTIQKTKDALLKLGLIFIFAAAAGNLIDRLFLGYVRDFISVWIWPTFNIADASGCIGAALLIIYMIKEEYPKIRKKIN